MNHKSRIVTISLTLVMLFSGCAAPGSPASGTEDRIKTPATLSDVQGISMDREDLCWMYMTGNRVPVGYVTKDSRKITYNPWSKEFPGTPATADQKVPLVIRYGMGKPDDAKKEYWEYTDSAEDLAFYLAEVAYLQAKGIEVITDHRAYTDTMAPALVAAFTEEQLASLTPRLNDEFYRLDFAYYYECATDQTDRYDKAYGYMAAAPESYTELAWPAYDGGYHYAELTPGEYREDDVFLTLSPSDRMMVNLTLISFGDNCVNLAEALQKRGITVISTTDDGIGARALLTLKELHGLMDLVTADSALEADWVYYNNFAGLSY